MSDSDIFYFNSNSIIPLGFIINSTIEIETCYFYHQFPWVYEVKIVRRVMECEFYSFLGFRVGALH